MKRILVLSDLHCGSIYGMHPPKFLASDDRGVPQNPGQAYLWRCWKDLAARVKRMRIHAVVVNGDVIDGYQRAQRGTELNLPMIADQAAAAEEVLKVMKKATGKAVWYFTQGTEYHDSKAGREIENVARSLGAQSYRGLGTGRHSREVLDLEVDGVVCNFMHGVSCSSGLYRATAPDREGIWSALAGKEGKMPKADAVVRSHAHFFVRVEHPTKHILITPCWELQTRFMRKNSAYRMLPDIGAVILVIDPAAKKAGEDPIHLKKILYPLPPIKTVKLGAEDFAYAA